MADVLTDLRALAARRADKALDAVVPEGIGAHRVLMMLGDFQFSVASAVPQTVQLRESFAWPGQDVIGGPPVLQSLGQGAASIQLPGRIYPHYRGGLNQMRRMKRLAGLGDAHLLVDALGVIYGDYAVVDVDETQSVFDATNGPRRIDFRISLARVSL